MIGSTIGVLLAAAGLLVTGFGLWRIAPIMAPFIARFSIPRSREMQAGVMAFAVAFLRLIAAMVIFVGLVLPLSLFGGT